MVTTAARRAISQGVLLRYFVSLLGPAVVVLVLMLSTAAGSSSTTLSHTFPAGWSLVSVPLAPHDADPHATFADFPAPLRLYSYQDGLFLHPQDPEFPPVEPGRGYWMLLGQETAAEISGTLIGAEEPAEVPLDEGWNLIGSPWLDILEWDDSRISMTDGETMHSLSDAIAEGWLESVALGYDPAAQEYFTLIANNEPADNLQPWQGYLVRSHINGQLLLAPPDVDLSEPTVELTSPEEDAELTGLVSIVGTADHANLLQYTLEYSTNDTGVFTEFASGDEPVVDGELGVLDTTLIPNGITRIRLTAVSLTGQEATVTQNVLVEGENKPGNFSVSFVDLEVPVSGVSITILRTYDSRMRSVQGEFGHGWEMEVVASGTYTNNRKPGDGWVISRAADFFNTPCSISNETKSHVTEIRFSDTEFYRFAVQVNMYGFGSAISGGCIGDMSFTQVGGVPGATLQIIGDPNVFWQNGRDYVTYDLGHPQFGNIYEPSSVRLTTMDGRQFDLSLTSGVTRIGDPNGNSLFISAGGVSHSSGKSVTFTRDGQGRITAITDPEGNSRAYTYDAEGNLAEATDRAGHTVTYDYDEHHFLTDIIDPQGNTPLRNEYDDQGRLVAQIDADGNRTEIDTDVAANQTSITDRLGTPRSVHYNDQGLVTEDTLDGATTEYDYDEAGNVLAETDPLGNTTSYTYDSNNNPLTRTDPEGNTTTYTYDSSGRVTSVTNPDGNTISYSYDASGNLLEVRNADDAVVESYAYDAAGNETQVTTPDGTVFYSYDSFGNLTLQEGPGDREKAFTYDANGNKLTETVKRTVDGSVVEETTTYTYDGNGNVLTVTDPLGNATTYTYDGNGNRLTETDPRGNTVSHQYDARDNRVRTDFPDGTFELFGYDQEDRRTAKTDRAGRTTFYQYDLRGNLVQVTFTDGSSVTHAYDLAGNRISTTDERGNTTAFTYDSLGRQSTSTDPLGNVTTHGYGPSGLQTSITDPLGSTTTFDYDQSLVSGPQVTSVIHPDGAVSTKTYTSSGLLASETDESGNTTSYEYDAAGNLVKVIDALGGETVYAYDEVGNRTSQTDAEGRTTTFTYDANGNLLQRTLPEGMSETFTYDAAGNKVSHTDFNGVTTTYTYDVMNRLVEDVFPDGSTVTYTYTATDKVDTVVSDRGTTTHAYDQRDRLVEVQHPNGVTIAYAYDAAGNRTSVAFLGEATGYEYDEANRLVLVTDPQGGETIYTYDAAGNRASVTHANGTSTHYTYDVRNRLTQIRHLAGDGSTVLSQYDYTLAPTGNRTRLEEDSGRVVDYTYDALHRLVTEADMRNGITVTTTYTYDAVGNRLSKDVDGAVTTYTYDDNDRMLTAGDDTLTYDANGNTTSRTVDGETTDYSYDAQDRLLEQIAPDGTVTAFTYDHAGNRVARDVDGTVTQFVVDTTDNSGLAQVVAELDESGAVTASYVHGDDLLRMRRGGEDYYYHADGVASIRVLTDADGDVTDTYVFDAFGNLLERTGDTENVYLFAGQQLDPNIGFYYMRARYMAPEYGRFISRDPWGGSIFDPPSLHKYSYAHNNPVTFTDPTGLFVSLSGLSASVSISSILSSMSLTHFTFAVMTVMVIQNLHEPGFAMRYGGLDLMAASTNVQVQAFARDMYQHGNFLIGLGSTLIGVNQQVLGFAQSFSGLAGSIRSIVTAQNLVAGAADTASLLRDLKSLDGALNDVLSALDGLAHALGQEGSGASRGKAQEESGNLRHGVNAFVSISLGILGQVETLPVSR